MYREPLCIGIKRGEFRANDVGAKQADVIFAGQRDAALQQAKYRCARCGYESAEDRQKKKPTALQVHHLDDNHQNNALDNLMAHCSLDHAYHHIGCNAPTVGGGGGWASQMVIANAPELSAEDMNLLQRAIGAALLDDDEKAFAKDLLDVLGALALPVKEVYQSYKAQDFAACFSGMNASQYESRTQYVQGFRILFHPNILKIAGAEMLQDAPMSAVSTWMKV